MKEITDFLFVTLSHTNIFIEVDRTAVVSEDEGAAYSTYLTIDGFKSFGKFSLYINNEYQKLLKVFQEKSCDKSSLKELKLLMRRISGEVFPVYEGFEIESLDILSYINQKVQYPQKSKIIHIEPNISITFIGCDYLEADGERISKSLILFIGKKIKIINNLKALVNNYFEIIESDIQNQKNQTFKFIDQKILDTNKFTAFKKNLVDHEFISPIAMADFAKCFSGKPTDKRINWADNELSLVFFVKSLQALKLINKKEKWIALSNSFLLDSEFIDNKKIAHTTAKCKLETQKKLNKFLLELLGDQPNHVRK